MDGGLNRRHARNKRLFDKKLTTYSFQEGDSVYLFRSVAQRGQYYKFIRPWKPAVVVKKLSDVNYRVRVLGGKKSVVVHHNRLKPRADDPSVPVGTPDLSIPSSIVSPSVEAQARQRPRQPQSPQNAQSDGDSYLSPFRFTPQVNGDPVAASASTERPAPHSAEPPGESEGESSPPPASVESPSHVPEVADVDHDVGRDVAGHLAEVPPDEPVPAVPVPTPRRSARSVRQPDWYRPS